MTRRLRTLSLTDWASLPIQARMTDQLSDLLFDLDDLLQLLQADGRSDFEWLEPNVQNMFNDIAALMRRMSD